MTAPGDINAPVVTSAPPDWATVIQDVFCPLCDYNLRGLIEPRCPECGYGFQWIDFWYEQKWQHPWLLEHARDRYGRSLLFTFAQSMRPGRFWRSVQPVHGVRVGRLLMYWITISLLVLLPFNALVVSQRISDYWLAHWVTGSIAMRAGQSLSLWSVLLWSPVRPEEQFIGMMELSLLLWPWLTFASLLVYRATMRHARIKTAHVLRCVVYSADAAAALALGILIVVAVGSSGLYQVRPELFLLWLAAPVLLSFRLMQAYRRYLHFPHAAAAVIASQLLVLMVFVNIVVDWLYF